MTALAEINLDEWRASIARKFACATVAQSVVAECRICGCTDECACADGCWWVEPDLCSLCQRGEAV